MYYITVKQKKLGHLDKTVVNERKKKKVLKIKTIFSKHYISASIIPFLAIKDKKIQMKP